MRRALVPFLAFLAFCTGLAAFDMVGIAQPGKCVTTSPPDPPFIPPFSPFNTPFTPRPGEFWYGADSLFTLLNTEGAWHGYHPNPGGPEVYSNKLFFWRLGYDWHSELRPRLFVNAVRLDRYAPAVSGLYPAANALMGDFGSMLTGIDLPTPGCWEITARYGSDSLSFVVSVKP